MFCNSCTSKTKAQLNWRISDYFSANSLRATACAGPRFVSRQSWRPLARKPGKVKSQAPLSRFCGNIYIYVTQAPLLAHRCSLKKRGTNSANTQLSWLHRRLRDSKIALLRISLSGLHHGRTACCISNMLLPKVDRNQWLRFGAQPVDRAARQ